MQPVLVLRQVQALIHQTHLGALPPLDLPVWKTRLDRGFLGSRAAASARILHDLTLGSPSWHAAG